MADKDVIWVGSAKNDISRFPDDAKRDAGFQIRLVQKGLEPDDAKAVPNVGPGTVEIRVHTDDAFRVFYVAKFSEGIYVLHAFQKTTQQTANRDIKLGQQRYRAMIAAHQALSGTRQKRSQGKKR